MSLALYQTSQDSGDRLSRKTKKFRWEKAPLDSSRIVYLNPEETHQTLLGFGGAFTESAADALSRVSPDRRRKALEAYFHPVKGIGYSFCRTHINSCDFSLGNYACCDTPGDFSLKTFHINREKEKLLPLIRDAIAMRQAPLRLFASPWSPPAWMKTNGEMNRGGKLKPSCRKAWALYYSKFIKAFRKEGVPIWGLTVQNEPQATQRWDSCLWSGAEEASFVRDYLGPTLAREGLSHVKIMIWDHNRDHLLRRAKETLKDPKTRKFVWGIAYHWYNGDFFEHLDAVRELFPDKPLVFSEGCNEYHLGRKGWQWPEHYGHDIIGDLNRGTVAWTDWNIVLDEKGGPNHVGNFCDAPVIADTKKDQIILRPSYYYMGHFSRFIIPGAKRIGFARSMENLGITAFKNPDGTIVLVALNRTGDGLEFQVKLGSRAFTTDIPPHAIQTYLISR